MSPKRTLIGWEPWKGSQTLPRRSSPGEARPRPRVLPLCAIVLSLGLGGSVGCDKYPTYKDVPINCSVTDQYDFAPLADFDNGAPPFWGPSGDTLCNPASLSIAVQSDAGPPCGTTRAAMVIRSSHCNDWGSLTGFSNFGTPAKDESACLGLSFWARAPGNSTKTFTILLDDMNTFKQDPPTMDASAEQEISAGTGSYCVDLTPDGGTAPQSGQSSGTMLDPSGNIIPGSTGAAPLPNQCGNSYSAIVAVTSEWRFYTIPWAKFVQDANPNRVPNSDLTQIGPTAGTALQTNRLRNLVLRFPKEAEMELWLAKLGFYAPKGSLPLNDAGRD